MNYDEPDVSRVAASPPAARPRAEQAEGEGSQRGAYGPAIFAQGNSAIALPSRLSRSRRRSLRTRSASSGTARECAHSEAEFRPRGATPRSSESNRQNGGPVTLAQFRSPWQGRHSCTVAAGRPENATRRVSLTRACVITMVSGIATPVVCARQCVHGGMQHRPRLAEQLSSIGQVRQPASGAGGPSRRPAT